MGLSPLSACGGIFQYTIICADARAFSLVPRRVLRYNGRDCEGVRGMNVLVSACLLGALCRFDGRCAADERGGALAGRHTLIPVCPEIYGGLPTPRPPGEIRDGRVIDRTGLDVTEAYARGAEAALAFARLTGCHHAVLKARSPSCGSGQIYDGHFSGRLVPGDGLTAALLKKSGIRVLTPEELDEIG
jgi:uncharacterized protein YbbK (DUF523 family)